MMASIFVQVKLMGFFFMETKVGVTYFVADVLSFDEVISLKKV